jgi:hypothetical protein
MPYKQKVPFVAPPLETFFYMIPLEPCCFALKRSMLEAHYPIPKSRKLYYGNKVEYISYARGVVTVTVQLNSGVTATLYLHAELDALHVACTCSMPDEKLCLHAYIGLYHLTWSHTLDLSPWYWPKYDNNEKVQQRYLDIQVANNNITARTKPAFGHLFRPVKELNGFPVIQQLSYAPSHGQHPMRGNRTVLAFCIGYGRVPADIGQSPILLACRAQTTVDNLSLHSFKETAGAREDNHLPAISSNQLCLLEIAVEMRQLLSYGTNNSANIKSTMLLLWEKALPMLVNEPYTCLFNPYKLVYKNGSIATLYQRFISPCRFFVSRPVLHFVIKINKDHLFLSAALSLNGKEVKLNQKPELFAVEMETGCYYLAQSVEADNWLNWMYARHNRITVLKAHFAEFHRMFLADLTDHFPVYVLQSSAGFGKLKLYNYQEVSESLDTVTWG